MEWFKAFWIAVGRCWIFLGRALRAVVNLALCLSLRPIILVLILLIAFTPLAGALYITLRWEDLCDWANELLCHLNLYREICPDDGTPEAEDEVGIGSLAAIWLASLGGIGALLTIARKWLAKSLLAIFNALKEAWKVDWFPARVMETTVAEAFNAHVLPAFHCVKKVIGWSLVVVFAFSGLVLGLAYLSTSKADESANEIVADIVRSVSSTENQIYFLDWAKPTFAFEKGTIFSLVFPSQGNLRTKKGICPADDGVTMRWLREFRAALATCPVPEKKNGNGLKLEVRAYASMAPVIFDGSDDRSDEFNCEIANQRAEAVARLLVAEEECFNSDYCKTNVGSAERPCGPAEDAGPLSRPNFSVRYVQWDSFEEMRKKRPMNDGTMEKRRHKAEFLNRSVHIIVRNDAC